MDKFPAFTPENVAMLWFDLDDTLWDMKGNSVICLRMLYELEHLERYFGTAEKWDCIYHSINDELWRQYSRGEISREFLRTERFARPLRLAGAKHDLALELSGHFDKLYLSMLGKQTTLVDGAKETLEALNLAGFRMGIVSNGFREVQYNKLRSGKIDKYFDIVVLSDDAGVNKPDKRFFDYAERQADSQGLLNIIVGDNYSTDITGAIEAGWTAIWLKTPEASRPQDCPVSYDRLLTVARLTEILSLFRLKS